MELAVEHDGPRTVRCKMLVRPKWKSRSSREGEG